MTLLQSALAGQERRALHEKDGKCRHADIDHGVVHILARARDPAILNLRFGCQFAAVGFALATSQRDVRHLTTKEGLLVERA